MIREKEKITKELESLMEEARKFKIPEDFTNRFIELLSRPEAKAWEKAWREKYPDELFAPATVWAKAHGKELKFYQKGKKNVRELIPDLLKPEDKAIISSFMDFVNEKYPELEWKLSVGKQPVSIPGRISVPKELPPELWFPYDISIMPKITKLIEKYGSKEVATGYDIFHELAHKIGIKDEEKADRFALNLLEEYYKGKEKREKVREKMREKREKLIEQDKAFKEKYPKIYSRFLFYKNLFGSLESKIKDNTVIREAELGYYPLWTETSLHDGLAVISVLKDYAKELEEHGYYIDITGEKVPLDELIFHEFLHVLGLFNPKMFEPSPLIIDEVPVRLTHENPPKTVNELRTRIKEINQWYSAKTHSNPTNIVKNNPTAKEREMKEKETWEMTREEFLDYQEKNLLERAKEVSPKSVELPALLITATKIRKRDPEAVRFQIEEIRKGIVERALKEGKPVPDEVLKDYPDLAEKYGRAVKERKPEKKKIEKKPPEEKIKIGAGWETIAGYNVDFVKALFPDWKWDKKKGTLTAPNEKIVMHALFSEIAPELEPHKKEIFHILNNLRPIFEKLGYELVVERPEEGKRVFFERARKDLKRLYDILGLELEEAPSEEEAMKEKKEFIEEKLKAVFHAYMKGADISEEGIEEAIEDFAGPDIESLAEAVASGRISQSEAVKRVEDYADTFLPQWKEREEEEAELEMEEEEEEEEEGYLPVIRPAIPRPPKRKPAKRKKRIRKAEEVTPEIAEPSAIAEKILREYPDELLAFGVGWVCENRRRELGFVDGANLGQVAWWLTKELRKKGDKIMARARRGVEYAAGMLLANQPDVIVQENVRQAMKREWDKIRTFVSVNYPDVLDKLGDKDVWLVTVGYVYKLLGSPYAGMPEDIRKALRTFEKLYGD